MGEEFQPCSDTSDLRELSLPQQLYLKPEAKLSITVALPSVRLPGKTISNWEVMERIKQAAEPEQFLVLKVAKSTLEFIRFEGEIDNRSQIPGFITRLDGKVIRLSGFPEPLKIRTAEAKPDFPTRHDWDKYFRDAKNMNEMKPGERPDTVHIQGLPSKWFVSKRDRRNGSLMPSEFCLEKVFEIFGEIRYVDIPMLDPYRNDMKPSISGIRNFAHMTDATFEAYIQYREYISFVKAMDAMRGMKLVHRDAVKAFSTSIKVDFDKTKHLSDMTIHRRRIETEKLKAKEHEKEEEKRREEEAVKRAMQDEEFQKEESKRQKSERRKEREEKRKQRILKKLKKKEAEQMNIKIAIEERKLLMAQRKLESIRLLDELFERIKVEAQKEITKQKEKELENQLSKVKKKKEAKLRKKEEKDSEKREKLLKKEKKLRKRLMKKIKSQQEQQMEERRERLRKTLEGKGQVKGKELAEAGETAMDYDMPMHMHYPYRGMGYRGWIPRGGFMPRGFYPRRPFRGYRGFGPYPFPPHYDPRSHSEHDDRVGDQEQRADEDRDASDAESSATSKYSNLDSSDEEKKKKHDGGKWMGYQGMMPPPPPWAGYSDFYHPRLMRRGRAMRVWGPYRGGPRFGPPDPNVPTNSYYMKNINDRYHRYHFNRLENDKDGDARRSSRSRSRSAETDRVVCRKVVEKKRGRTRSRSRSRHRSRSRSSSRSKSRSRRRSRSRSRSRSKSRSRRRSKSHSRSRSRHRTRSRSKSRSRSRSKRRSRSRSRRRRRSSSRSHSRSRRRSRSRSRSKSKRRSKSKENEKKAEGGEVAKSTKSRSRSKSKEQTNDIADKMQNETNGAAESVSSLYDKDDSLVQVDVSKSQKEGPETEAIASKVDETITSESVGEKSKANEIVTPVPLESDSKTGKPDNNNGNTPEDPSSKSQDVKLDEVRKIHQKKSDKSQHVSANQESGKAKTQPSKNEKASSKKSETARLTKTAAKQIIPSRKLPEPKEDDGDDCIFVGSDVSLSLSGSVNEEWSSPERKSAPLGVRDWEARDRRYVRNDREFDFRRDPRRREYRERSEDEPRRPLVRSMVSRPITPPRPRSPVLRSLVVDSRRNNQDRSRERDREERRRSPDGPRYSSRNYNR